MERRGREQGAIEHIGIDGKSFGPYARRRGKPRRYKKANALHAFLVSSCLCGKSKTVVEPPRHQDTKGRRFPPVGPSAHRSRSRSRTRTRCRLRENIQFPVVGFHSRPRVRERVPLRCERVRRFARPPNLPIANPQFPSPVGAGSRAATKRRMRRGRPIRNPRSAIRNSPPDPPAVVCV